MALKKYPTLRNDTVASELAYIYAPENENDDVYFKSVFEFFFGAQAEILR